MGKKGKKDKRHHMTLHDCNYCQKYFPSNDRLKKHLIDDHPADDSRNKDIYLNSELICAHCKRCFVSRDHLQKHMNASCYDDEVGHQNKETSLECTACDMFFSSKSSLTEHLQTRHMCETVAKCPCCAAQVRTPNPHVRSMETQTHKFHACDRCEEAFENARDLHWHLLKKHDVTPAPVRIRAGGQRGRLPRQQALVKKILQCKLCPQKCASVKALTHHEQECHQITTLSEAENNGKKRAHQCLLCKESFPLRGILLKHTRTVHPGQEMDRESPVKKWICHKCGQTYGRKAYLTVGWV